MAHGFVCVQRNRGGWMLSYGIVLASKYSQREYLIGCSYYRRWGCITILALHLFPAITIFSMNYKKCFTWLLVACSCTTLWADGPQDNIPEKVRPVPPLGIELSDSDRQELLRGVDTLHKSVNQLRQRDDVFTVDLLPDVEIFLRAVTQGINYRELFSARDVKNAAKVLAEGQQRAEALLKGEAPWTSQKGLVVRGFRSRIDRTVQPYGLVIPDSYTDVGTTRYRLDPWLAGRPNDDKGVHERVIYRTLQIMLLSQTF